MRWTKAAASATASIDTTSTRTSTPLTSQPARAYGVALDADGRRFAFSSNEKNGTDSDIYVVDVTDPASRRMVFRGDGDFVLEGWTGNGQLLLSRAIGMRERAVFLHDPETGRAEPVLGEDQTVLVTTSEPARPAPLACVVANLAGDEFADVHAFDPATRTSTPLTPGLRWDVVHVAAMAGVFVDEQRERPSIGCRPSPRGVDVDPTRHPGDAQRVGRSSRPNTSSQPARPLDSLGASAAHPVRSTASNLKRSR